MSTSSPGVERMSVSDEGGDGADEAYRALWSPSEENELEAPLVPIMSDGTLDEAAGTFRFSWRKLWAHTGPGWLMSIAYLDPGNLESDLQSGVQAGYSLIWVLFWATMIGLLYQVLALRIGVVTGHDLAQVCRHEYPRADATVVWLMVEAAIIGSDIQEVVGSAIAMKLLFGLPIWGGVLITACDTFTFMLIQLAGVRKLEALFGALILIMVVCFFTQFFQGSPDYPEVLKGWFVPTIPSGTAETVSASIGAVIMPHNLFLHSALVKSRKFDHNNKLRLREANYYFTIESAVSLLVSFFINLAVVGVFAKHFGGKTIGLSNAGEELRGAFGHSSTILWGVGLLAAGQSSTMTGTFAGQHVMSGFLRLKIPPWKRTLLTRSIALVPAMVFALLAHKSMDSLNQWLNVLQSIVLPFALLPLVIFSSNRHIMGEFALGAKAKALLWALLIMILATNVYLVEQFSEKNLPSTPATFVALSLITLLYFGFVLRLTWLSFQPSRSQFDKLERT